MTTIRGISESRDDHFEAVFVRTPRVRDVLEGDIVGLRVDDPILTHVCSGLVTTDTFLYKRKSSIKMPKIFNLASFFKNCQMRQFGWFSNKLNKL